MDKTETYLYQKKDIIKLLVPVLVEQLLLFAVAMVVILLSSKIGETTVAAVSLVTVIDEFIIQIFAAIASAGAIIAGYYLGANDRSNAHRTASLIILYTGFVSIGVTILAFFGRNQILTLAYHSLEPDVMRQSSKYLAITLWSIPFMAEYTACVSFFRIMAKTHISLTTAFIMNLINITGSIINIYVFHTGVTGIALSLVVSRIVVAVISLYILSSGNLEIYIHRKVSFYYHKGIMKKVLDLGVLGIFENIQFQLGKIIPISLIASFGTYAISANAVSNTILMFPIFIVQAVSLSIVPVVARCMGSNEIEQLQFYTKKFISYAYMILWITCPIIIVFSPTILSWFKISAEATQIAKYLIWLNCISAMILYPLAYPVATVLRTVKDMKFTVLFATISLWSFKVLLAYILAKPFALGIYGIWIAISVDWLFRSIVFTNRYLKRKWLNINNKKVKKFLTI